MNSKFVHVVPALILSLIAVGLGVYGLTMETRQSNGALKQIDPEGQREGVTEEEAAPSFTYAIARQTLQAGEVLERDAVLAVDSIEELKGLVQLEKLPFGEPLTARLDKGLPITQGILDAQNPVQQLLSPGHKAVAVELTNLSSIGGLVRPGDSVDIFASFKEEDGASAVSTRLFSSVPVLAVRGATSVTDDLDDDEKRRNPTMVLAISESEVPKLTLALIESELTFAATKPSAVIGDALMAGSEEIEAVRPETERLVSFTSDIRPEKAPKERSQPQRQSEYTIADDRREILVFEGAESRSVYVQ